MTSLSCFSSSFSLADRFFYLLMPTSSFLYLFFLLLHVSFTSSAPALPISKGFAWRSLKNSSDQNMGTGSCRTGNPIDDCWKCDPNWEANRRMLADCAVGFGRNAIGGRDGEIYVVTDPENDDPKNPNPGTIRYAAIQEEPLWIIFDHDMDIHLKAELIMNSYKTIDGRGFNIAISNGPCLTIENVTNIIIHGIYVHGCVPGGNIVVRDRPDHYGSRDVSDGDGISLIGARDVWIDHCTLTKCTDGLIDIVYGSTGITISNNYMFDHNEVMLMGHDDDFLDDKNMQVTIAFNYFDDTLIQRMPRCRHGYFHIVNNVYAGWKMYAIGGSAGPTINSQGNVFIASDDVFTKEVTKRQSTYSQWKDWNWRSDGDLMLNGAYFTSSGKENSAIYAKASSMVARPTSILKSFITTAGVVSCKIGEQC